MFSTYLCSGVAASARAAVEYRRELLVTSSVIFVPSVRPFATPNSVALAYRVAPPAVSMPARRARIVISMARESLVPGAKVVSDQAVRIC
jgi:hypothetical protein